MSCTAILWALGRGREHKVRDNPDAPWRTMSASERMVLITVCDRSNGSRQCWPSMKCIANDTGLSDRQVRTIVHRLEDAGLIRMELRGRSMHYWINRPDDAEQRKPVPPSGDSNQPIAEASSPIAEVSSAIPGDDDAEQRKPVPADSGNGAHSTPEPTSAKPIKKNLSRNLRRACAREAVKNSDLKGSAAAAPPERAPSVAEIEARRREHAATMEALPPVLATALSKLAGQVDKVAYAPGWSPRLTPDEQVAAADARPRIKPRHLTPEQLALARAGYRAPVLPQRVHA